MSLDLVASFLTHSRFGYQISIVAIIGILDIYDSFLLSIYRSIKKELVSQVKTELRRVASI